LRWASHPPGVKTAFFAALGRRGGRGGFAFGPADHGAAIVRQRGRALLFFCFSAARRCNTREASPSWAANQRGPTQRRRTHQVITRTVRRSGGGLEVGQAGSRGAANISFNEQQTCSQRRRDRTGTPQRAPSLAESGPPTEVLFTRPRMGPAGDGRPDSMGLIAADPRRRAPRDPGGGARCPTRGSGRLRRGLSDGSATAAQGGVGFERPWRGAEPEPPRTSKTLGGGFCSGPGVAVARHEHSFHQRPNGVAPEKPLGGVKGPGRPPGGPARGMGSLMTALVALAHSRREPRGAVKPHALAGAARAQTPARAGFDRALPDDAAARCRRLLHVTIQAGRRIPNPATTRHGAFRSPRDHARPIWGAAPSHAYVAGPITKLEVGGPTRIRAEFGDAELDEGRVPGGDRPNPMVSKPARVMWVS